MADTDLDDILSSEPEAKAPEVTQPEAEAPKEPEAQKAESEEKQPVPEEAPAEPDGKRDQNFVPLSAVLEERERAKGFRKEVEDLQRKLNALEEKKGRPDPVEDPAAWSQWVERDMDKRLIRERFTISEQFARKHHGDELVEQAMQAVLDANDPYLSQRIQASPDPLGETVKWFRDQQTLKEIGDPAAYRDKIAKDLKEQLRAEILAELQQANPGQEAGAQVKPDQPKRPTPVDQITGGAAPKGRPQSDRIEDILGV